MNDYERESIERLARIEGAVSALSDKVDSLCNRTADLEHTVNGNGRQGLAERVRFIEWKIAAICSGVVIVFNLLKEAFMHGVGK